MKVIVTALKAPWPAGAGLGSVVQIPGDALPGWALGKCRLAADDAEVTHTLAGPELVVNPEPDPAAKQPAKRKAT